MIRRLLVGAATVLLVASCSSSPEHRLRDQLQDQLENVHGGYLDVRSRDPYSTGSRALEKLDPYDYALESSVDGDAVVLVRGIAAEVFEENFAAAAEERSMGACVEVTVVAGSGGGDRGSVRTEPVPCPAGTSPDDDVEGAPVQEVTTDLDGRSDDVPEPRPDRAVCISGEVCTEGGG